MQVFSCLTDLKNKKSSLELSIQRLNKEIEKQVEPQVVYVINN